MALGKGKTEHAGAKNGGGGMWGRRADVKRDSDKLRRAAGKEEARDEVARMSGNEVAAGMDD